MKILLFDAESFPNEGWTWGTWEQRVIEVINRRAVCSIAWQWYPSREKHVLALPDFPGYDPKKRTNKLLMRAFAKELAKADIAIGHNINQFDNPMVNTDLLLNGIAPPPPHRTIDTLQVCRYRFRLNSNKLDDVCQELGIGKKVEHPGFEMWKGCMRGDAKSWALMKKYNLGDVDPLLRGLYEHVRPWMTRHPNLGAERDFNCCPSCSAPPVRLKHDGVRHTQGGSYKKVLCLACRAWCRGVVVRGRMIYRTYS